MLSRRLRDAAILHQEQKKAQANKVAITPPMIKEIEVIEVKPELSSAAEAIAEENAIDELLAKIVYTEEDPIEPDKIADPEDGADDEINLEELSDAARKLIKKSLRAIKDEVETGLWDQHLDVLLVLEEERTQGPRAGLEKIVDDRLEDIQAQ